MESIHLFLQEVTTELLYNIVYDSHEIDQLDLSEAFELKTGYRPMDFFGFGNETGRGWLDFIKGIPSVQARMRKISIVSDQFTDSSDENSDYQDNENEDVYKVFNKTYLYLARSLTVANYREMILIKCCEMIDNDDDLSHCKDANGNTPLHYIAALPGLTYDCDTLVKYLLQAGVDPLATNDDEQTFLHIIFGRYCAENDNDLLCFDNTLFAKTKWFMEDRVVLLHLLSEKLSPTYTTLLAKAQDRNGNTALHECLLSTTVNQFTVEVTIFQELLKFGASLRVINNSGEVPLHYAYHPELFKIFLQNGAVCRARNDRDESPVLFILKKSTDLAFVETSAVAKLVDEAFVKTTLTKSVSGATKLLKNLKNIVSENKDAKKTVWIPDVKGNVAINVLLVAIRIGSQGFLNWDTVLCPAMVELLREMLRNAPPSEMKWANEKGQSFLHVLLEMGDDTKHTTDEEQYIYQSLEILLKHGADVNAVDLQGRSPLDITYKYHNKKCIELLMKYGAIRQHDAWNNSSPRSATNSLTHTKRNFSNLSVRNETRKLRSCPKRHLGNAERLTDPRTQVTVVGKYRYSSQNLIGSGAFSSIFVTIKDENVGSKSRRIQCRAFALKRIEKAKMNSKDIKREITTLISISDKCEHIIKYHESFEDDNFQYLCLDLMDGDLHEFVTNDNVNKVLKANPASGVQITRELVDGLAFLHKKKFIHRDLKPGNILYTTDPTLHFKIADFGLIKDTTGSSMMSSTRGSGVAMAAGTRCWMAPELVSMKTRDHTEQSDIFSLGLVLYYLLTLGKHPFGIEEEPAHVIETKIVKLSPNLDRALDPEPTSFFQILLAKDPSKRPLAAYLNRHPVMWSETKKIEFLKAVGDQPEAENPTENPNSELEQRLQTTYTGEKVGIEGWDQAVKKIYEEMTTAWKQKKYRTKKLIDLIRFIRNAYAHRQDRSDLIQTFLGAHIFTRVFPSLVLDVFVVVRRLKFDETRNNIREALSLST